MNRSEDLISVLAEDHRELKQLFTELEMLYGGEKLRRSLTDQMIIEVVRHSVAEETYLYPVARERLPDGGWIADEAEADHRRLEQILKRLEQPDLPDDHFSLLLSWLVTGARQHIDDEEERMFPLLAKHVSEEELVSLGEKANMAKARALSRLSPAEPEQPLLHMILKTGLGLVERVREHICGPGNAYDPDGP
jgi:hemerythrin-like domain-containing protein